MYSTYNYSLISFKDFPDTSKCYKCGRIFYRNDRSNGKCPICLQRETERKNRGRR